MKSIYRKLSVVTIILFIVSSLLTAFLLYKLPAKLVYEDKVLPSQNLHLLQSSLSYLNLFIVISLFLALLSIVLMMLGGKNSSTIAYVNPFAERSTSSNDQHKETEAGEGVEERLLYYQKLLESTDDHSKVIEKILWELCKELEASQGAIYLNKEDEGKRYIELYSSYAFIIPESQTLKYEYGEGLAGQVAKSGEALYIDEVPEGYIKILSGLGSANPTHLAIIPMIKQDNVMGVTEIASFKNFSKRDKELMIKVLNSLVDSLRVQEEAVKDNEL